MHYIDFIFIYLSICINAHYLFKIERKKEIERRELGKNMQVLKDSQDEMARKKVIEERKKMKQEEK